MFVKACDLFLQRARSSRSVCIDNIRDGPTLGIEHASRVSDRMIAWVWASVQGVRGRAAVE